MVLFCLINSTYPPNQLVEWILNPLSCTSDFFFFLVSLFFAVPARHVKSCVLVFVFNVTSMYKCYSNYSSSTLFAVKLPELAAPLWHFSWQRGERCLREQHNEGELRTQWQLSMSGQGFRQSHWDQKTTVWMGAFCCRYFPADFRETRVIYN